MVRIDFCRCPSRCCFSVIPHNIFSTPTPNGQRLDFQFRFSLCDSVLADVIASILRWSLWPNGRRKLHFHVDAVMIMTFLCNALWLSWWAGAPYWWTGKLICPHFARLVLFVGVVHGFTFRYVFIHTIGTAVKNTIVAACNALSVRIYVVYGAKS